MAISVIMPALEMAQETGKIVSWRKKEGETVKKGETLLEVETDKAVVEIEATGDGILAAVKAFEGAVIPVGQTIAWLVQPGEAPPKEVEPSQTGRRIEDAPAGSVAPVAAAPEQAASQGGRASPKARRLAKEHGIDISRVRGTSPEGEILASDILKVVESQPSGASGQAPAPARAVSSPALSGGIETLNSIGRLMAERTTQSWTTVPHFFVTREIDASALVAAREKHGPLIESGRGVKLTVTDLLIALVSRVLAQHPRMNASWTAEGIRHNSDVNMGVAMAVNDAVVAPVIQKAHAASLGEIAVQRRDLAERARAGRLHPSDLTSGTFTISNLGMYQVDAFTAIIVSPQAGILAVGAIVDRVVPVETRGGIGVRPMLALTLSCDHRVVDGARGAAFLKDLAAAIREPEKFLS